MKRELILIVDDDPRGRKLICDLLDVHGYTTVTTGDGVEAVALAKKRRPDLILMDIQLPGMDGIAVMKALKSDPKTEGVPIIAITAYAMTGDEERLRSQGFDDFLAKPIDIHALLKRIRFYLHEEA